MKTRKLITISILILLFVSIGLYLLIQVRDRNVVATIDKNEITKKEFEKYIMDNYGKNILDQQINEKLINIEIKNKNIIANDTDIKKQVELLKSSKTNTMGVTDSIIEENAKQRVLTIKLIKSEIDESKLKAFFSQNPLYSDDVFSINVYETKTMEEAMSLVDMINVKKISASDASSKSIKVDKLIFKYKESPFTLDLTAIKEGVAYHEHDILTDKHLVLFVDKITKGTLLDYDKDKEAVKDIYIDKYYDDEYLALLNKLKTKYDINMKIKF